MQPKLDYCSQIWSPADQTSTNKVEEVQRHMVNRIRDSKLVNLNYCEKLQERIRERYMVIFLWKISQGIVSGFNFDFSLDERRGRTIIPRTVVKSDPSNVKKARERTLAVRGAQIFNLLPVSLRSMNSDHVDLFKNHLDVFLYSIPDQPTMTGLGEGQRPIASFTSYHCITH